MTEYQCSLHTGNTQCENPGTLRLFDDRFPPTWWGGEAYLCDEHWQALDTIVGIAQQDPELAMNLLNPNVPWKSREEEEQK